MADAEVTGTVCLPEDESKTEDGEPPLKKPKRDNENVDAKFAQRLENILCCVVCLDLPVGPVYQCSNGHLMCAGCFSRLLADSRIREDEGKCPTCRVELSKQSATRNLAVENAIYEFPSACRFCKKEYPRNILKDHETDDCDVRLWPCKFQFIGCSYVGPYIECMEHERICGHPEMTGKEIMELLTPVLEKNTEEKRHLHSIFELLSFEKIIFNDIQLRPFHSNEYVHKLYYETSRFSAFFHQWQVRTRISAANADASQSLDRSMTYQLSLKTNTKPSAPIVLYYLAVHGPYGNMKLKPRIYKFAFSDTVTDTPFVELPLEDSAECNRVLASKTINFRLIMFIVTK